MQSNLLQLKETVGTAWKGCALAGTSSVSREGHHFPPQTQMLELEARPPGNTDTFSTTERFECYQQLDRLLFPICIDYIVGFIIGF